MAHDPAKVVSAKAHAKPKPTEFRLPPTISGPADVTQLARELESLENYLYQAGLRAEALQLPKLSRAFSDIAELNRLDMLQESDRKTLQAFLQVLHSKAPVLHISFSVEPSSAFTAKIVTWLRGNISPFVLVHIGKQPTIGGGCVVRTTNKQFDFSFRQYMNAKRDVLVEALARSAEDAKRMAA